MKNFKSFSPYYQLILWLAIIISVLRMLNINILTQNTVVNITSTCIIILYFIIVLLNSVLYTRIGNIEFANRKIVISKDHKQSEFLLSNIKIIKISKEQNKHYLVEANPFFKEVIELNNTDLLNIKSYLDENQIEYQHKSIANWFRRFN
ncbi:hypothetical protein GTQ40_03570 [Flavobacteriaceae bacterium R38]|nr:hypothetical protein [Flavobacteriaceae bacterium R38]